MALLISTLTNRCKRFYLNDMNERIIQILKNIQTDKRYVIQLEELYKAKFLTLIRAGSEKELASMEFLTYPTEDNIAELPIFTAKEFLLHFASIKSIMVELEGEKLWRRLLEIVQSGTLEVAIDPGQNHGIRINKEMILGMISMYDNH
jgi:hypothetical protein